MKIEDISNYLDFVMDTTKNEIYFCKTSCGTQYKIIFHKAVELEPPCTFLLINKFVNKHKYKYYYTISNNIISWGEKRQLPISIQKYVERLMKLSTFM